MFAVDHAVVTVVFGQIVAMLVLWECWRRGRSRRACVSQPRGPEGEPGPATWSRPIEPPVGRLMSLNGCRERADS